MVQLHTIIVRCTAPLSKYRRLQRLSKTAVYDKVRLSVVRQLSADCARLEVQLYRRLCDMNYLLEHASV